jgi:hypothetical protein
MRIPLLLFGFQKSSRSLCIGLLVALALCAAGPKIPAGSKVFIESSDGFDIYLTKALEKKKVPLVVVGDKEQCDFVISTTSSHSVRPDLWKGVGKALGGGNQKTDSSVDEAAIKVTNRKTGAIIVTDEIRKSDSLRGKRSAAEALAKRLKESVGTSQ